MSSRQVIKVIRRKSRSRRAGLLFPVGRIHRLCRKGPWVGSRISAGAPVYLTAVMEYLAAELLEQAGVVARHGSSGRISPRHIKKAVKTDKELDQLCEGVVMAGGGEEVEEKEIALNLLRADMEGDLRGPAHGSSMRNKPDVHSIKRKKSKTEKKKTWRGDDTQSLPHGSCLGNEYEYDPQNREKKNLKNGKKMHRDVMIDLTAMKRGPTYGHGSSSKSNEHAILIDLTVMEGDPRGSTHSHGPSSKRNEHAIQSDKNSNTKPEKKEKGMAGDARLLDHGSFLRNEYEYDLQRGGKKKSKSEKKKCRRENLLIDLT